MAEDTTRSRLKLVLVTHERKLLDMECDEVSLPGKEGVFGILPGHTPLISALRVGEMMIRDGKNQRYLALSWGFCEVADDVVTVLAEFAQTPDEIDLDAARSEVREAEAALNSAVDEQWEEIMSQLEEAQVRIEVGKRVN